MLNDWLAIAMLLIGFLLLFAGLMVRRIVDNARRMTWRPRTCSKSCDAETRYQNKRDWKRYYEQLTE